jgi:sarcosine oxidase subunit beta
MGITSKRIAPAELKELQPHARIDDVAIAAYEPDAGFVDPLAATTTLATRAKELGVNFKTGTLVKNIRVQMNRVCGVDTTVGEIDALTIVVAAGAWTDRLLKPLGVQVGIQSIRAQVAFFDRPPALKAGHAAFIDYITGAYFRPHTYGLTMVGLNTPVNAETNPDAFDENVPNDFVNEMRQRLAARLPAMTNARFIRGHAGIYDVTPDNRPIISRVPGIAGLMVAAGFGGAGFAVAPAVGACVAEIITQGEARMVDVKRLEIGNEEREQLC